MNEEVLKSDNLNVSIQDASHKEEVYADILCRRTSLLNDYEYYKNDTYLDMASEDDTFNISFIQKHWDGKKDDKRKSLIGHNVQVFNKSLAYIATNYATDEESLTTNNEENEEETEDNYESSDTSGPIVNKKIFNFKSMNSKKIFKLWYKLENELNEIEKTYPDLIAQNVQENLDNLVQTLKKRIDDVQKFDENFELEKNEFLDKLEEMTSQLAVKLKTMKEKVNLFMNENCENPDK